jgi:NADH-quinone oxidoreductase subunit E
LGVWTYAQIAELSQAEIAWLDDELGFSGRIERDNWTGQAKVLAAARTDSGGA